MATATPAGSRCEDITYAGESLSYNGQTYYWRIKFWDAADAEGEWSTTTAGFTMTNPQNSDLYTDCISAQDGRSNPAGFKCGAPAFSSVYNSSGDPASRYRLQVNTASSFDGQMLYDSGENGKPSGEIPDGARSGDIAYRGDPLGFSGNTYYWRIKYWDINGVEGDFSTTTDSFTTADANVLQNTYYSYDLVGNIAEQVEASDTNAAKTMEYAYDDLYRLTRASSTNAVNNQDYLRTYAYNAIGNITNKSDIGNYSYTDSGYSNPHAATNINGATYAYDNNGNLISDGTWTHTWDYDNRLIGSTNGSTTISYGYDHTGARVLMDNGTDAYHYPNRYYNLSGATSTKHVFANNELVATIESNGATSTIYYIHTDHLGGSSVVTDQEGEVQQILDYMPFGDIRLNESIDSFDEKKKFTGYEHDDETDLEYAKARYYNANIGRFISKDTWEGDLLNPQSFNKYAYSLNNPIRYIDPTGNEPFDGLRKLWNKYPDSIGRKINSEVQGMAQAAKEVMEWVYGDFNDAYSFLFGRDFSGDEISNGDRAGIAVVAALPLANAKIYKSGKSIIRFVTNVTTDYFGRIFKGTVDLKPTLDRIEKGETLRQFRHDGTTYRNDPNKQGSRLLPEKPSGYYTEWVHPTPGTNTEGSQRIITGQGGEIYYSPDHYDTMIRLDKPE